MLRLVGSKLGMALAPMTLILTAALPASGQLVFFTDFNAGAPAQFSGFTGTESVQGFAGLGPAGNQFGGNFLRNDTTGNPASASTLTLTGLPAHTAVNVDFLLGVIDSWDGQQAPDIFNVTVDATSVFAKSFAIASGTSNYTPPAGGDIGGGTVQRGWSFWGDQAYNMYVEPAFHNIPHTASTLTVSWFASGNGWQGGFDESWGIDNVGVTLLGGVANNVPEPSAFAFLGTGGLAFLLLRRRKRA